jgi:hypothetical protein
MVWDWGLAGGGAASGAMIGNMIVPGLGAVGGAGIGALSGLFGHGKKSYNSGDDPLAGIRQQLQDLANQVPGMTAANAEAIKNQYAQAQKTGLQNIRESLYADRGLGATSIEPQYNLDYLTNLTNSEQSALAQNEQRGLQEQANILGGAGQLAGQEQPDQPSILSQILGMGAQVGGNLLGQNWLNSQQMNRYKDLFSNQNQGGANSWLTNIINSPASNTLPNTTGKYNYGAQLGM